VQIDGVYVKIPLILLGMATPSSYRPRQKKKFPPTAHAPGSNNDLVLDPGTPRAAPMFPLVSFLWAARGGISQWLILPLILMVVGLYRWAVSLWGYSGMSYDSASSSSLQTSQ
jgi:alpha-1,3-glucosyltransferase